MKDLQSSLPAKQYLQITSMIAHVDDIKGKKVVAKFKSGVNQAQTEDYISKSGEVLCLGDY